MKIYIVFTSYDFEEDSTSVIGVYKKINDAHTHMNDENKKNMVTSWVEEHDLK